MARLADYGIHVEDLKILLLSLFKAQNSLSHLLCKRWNL